MNKILVIGAGGLAIQMIDDLLSCDFQPVFYDDNTNQSLLLGFEITQSRMGHQRCIIGVSEPQDRKKLSKKFTQSGVIPQNLISKKSSISNRIEIQENVTVLQNCIVENQTVIGYGSLLNIGCFLCHGSKLGKFVTLSPRVTVLGNVEIGDLTFIGAGSIIREKIKIGENSIIGMGSIVVSDIPANVVAYGNPCKVIKENK